MALILNLFRAYLDKDCSLAEINPLVVTKDGRVLALDAKLNFDDNALYRHKDVVALATSTRNTLEVEASSTASLIKLDGNVAACDGPASRWPPYSQVAAARRQLPTWAEGPRGEQTSTLP